MIRDLTLEIKFLFDHLAWCTWDGIYCYINMSGLLRSGLIITWSY